MRTLLRNAVKRHVSKVVEETIDCVLRERLPTILANVFRTHPDQELNQVGFRWAFYLSLREVWPNVRPEDAFLWCDDYAGCPVGTTGYEWTARAARSMAAEYAKEFGE